MNFSKLSMSLLVKHSKIFPDETINVHELLRPYGRNLVLEMVAVLNSILQRNIKTPPEQLRSWFGQENPLAREMFSLVYQGYREELINEKPVYIINDYANLRLNEIGSNFEVVEGTQAASDDEIHMNLFKAYLWLNEEYLLKQENISDNLPEGLSGFDKTGWMATATLLSYYDFTYSDQEYIFLAQLIKAQYCFQFISEYHPEAYNIYLASYNIRSFNDYAGKITPLANLCFTDVVSFNPTSPDDEAFLDRYDHFQDITDNESNREDYDFIQIRNRPIFKTAKGRYLLLNRSMVINKIYSSVYWDVKRIFVENPQFGITENQFRKDFTGRFSEEFMVYKLLEKAYGHKKYKQFSGVEMKAVIGDTEPDYYIRNGNKLFLYEVKDSFIAGKIKQDFNVPAIEKELKKKYFGRDTPGQEKAVKQLVTRIKQCLLGGYEFDANLKVQSLNIFPILVVYDINLTVPGIERVLMNWFKTEMNRLSVEMEENGITGYKVNELVVIHIDGLTMVSEYLSAGKLQMEYLIKSYLERYRKLLKQTDGMTFRDLQSNILKSYLSFQHYVMDTIMSIKPKDRLVPRELKSFD